MSVLNKRYFTSEKAAFKHFGKVLWPEGPVCPKCGSCTANLAQNTANTRP